MLKRTLTIGILVLLPLSLLAAGPPAQETSSLPGGMDDATRALFNQLPAEIQSDITDNIVPSLVSGWHGLTQAKREEETANLLEFVVQLEYDTVNAVNSATESTSTVPCSYKTRLGSSQLVVYAGHIASCGGEMYAMKAGVRLKGPNYDPGWTEATIKFGRRASAYDSSTYSGSALWKAWGSGTAYPKEGGPLPSPDGGDCQIFANMPAETETCG